MSKDDAEWADELLQRVHATTGPEPEDAARNLASIEARLGILRAPAGPPQSLGSATVQQAASRGRAGAALAPKALPLTLKVGLVLAFGVVTGVVGYIIGRTESEIARDLALREHALPDLTPRGLAPSDRAEPTRTGSLEPLATGGALEASAPVGSSTPASNDTPSAEGAPRATAAAARHRAPPQSRTHRASSAAKAAPPAASNVDAEAPFDLRQALELLRRAEEALRRSDGLEARMWLSDLDRRAPAQLLIEERLVTRALADCALSDVAEARRTLHELERANPQSIYRARLEGSCVASSRSDVDREPPGVSEGSTKGDRVDSKSPPAPH